MEVRSRGSEARSTEHEVGIGVKIQEPRASVVAQIPPLRGGKGGVSRSPKPYRQLRREHPGGVAKIRVVQYEKDKNNPQEE